LNNAVPLPKGQVLSCHLRQLNGNLHNGCQTYLLGYLDPGRLLEIGSTRQKVNSEIDQEELEQVSRFDLAL
ncbi:MAG: hypothetical protein OEM26_18505, partial [Saprospiraceae bacterium]|nr:hypothetical protein [Saprospiraceae bacterium]